MVDLTVDPTGWLLGNGKVEMWVVKRVVGLVDAMAVRSAENLVADWDVETAVRSAVWTAGRSAQVMGRSFSE